MNVNEYNNLLARSNLPNKCILLPDAKTLLTSSAQHCDDCVKYGLVSAGMQGGASSLTYQD
ncbi:unnamed protein product, partial [Rotaria socialis]